MANAPQTLHSKNFDSPIKDYEKYSFCEPSTAIRNTWHIRKLDSSGKHLGGGITTASLCGLVKPTVNGGFGGWDLSVVFTPHHLSHCCRECREAFIKETET